MSQAPSMRKRHRFNRRMTRIVLLISFIFFFGRFVYSSIGAWYHHQDKKQSQQSTITVEPSIQQKRLSKNKRSKRLMPKHNQHTSHH